jgi:hypothetical protein
MTPALQPPPGTPRLSQSPQREPCAFTFTFKPTATELVTHKPTPELHKKCSSSPPQLNHKTKKPPPLPPSAKKRKKKKETQKKEKLPPSTQLYLCIHTQQMNPPGKSFTITFKPEKNKLHPKKKLYLKTEV